MGSSFWSSINVLDLSRRKYSRFEVEYARSQTLCNKGSCIVGPALLVGILIGTFNFYKCFGLLHEERISLAFGLSSFILPSFYYFVAFKLVTRDCRIYLFVIFFMFIFIKILIVY